MIATTVSDKPRYEPDNGGPPSAALSDLDKGAIPRGIDAERFRAAQVESILRHVPALAAANLASALVLLWVAWDSPLRHPLLVWAVALIGISSWVCGYWLMTRHRRPAALGLDSLRTVEFYACLVGIAWAALPAACFMLATPELRTVVYAVTLAAAGCGTLALARVPSAAIIFCAIISAALAVTALRMGNQAGPVLSVMTMVFMAVSTAIVFSMHRAAVERALGAHELNRKREIISLLLKDFEHDAGDWLWETDQQGRLIVASDRFYEAIGRTRDAVGRTTLRAIAGAGPDMKGWPEFADAIARHGSVSALEVMTGGERPGYWQLTARPRYGADGEFLGYQGVGRDVSAERHARDSLIEAKDQAERRSEAKTRFLAVMSHELKTPLNSIIGFSEIMAEAREGPIGTPVYADYANMIHASSLQLRRIIDDVLELSRIENGTLKIVDRDGDAMELLEVARNSCASAAKEKSVKIALGSTPGARIRGDATRLQQVLIELLSNAIKFSKSGSLVEIAVEREDGDRLIFVIRDSGIGIAKEDMTRIFEPFVQADSSMARRFGGMGLGLAISRRIARLHGGDIVLESELDAGTTAKFSLPAERITWSIMTA
jgi:signal transduction histidine kinase